MGMAKTRTSPYRPSSNGQIERQNRTILQIIRCMIKGNVTNWDKDLPQVLMAMHYQSPPIHPQSSYAEQRDNPTRSQYEKIRTPSN